MSSGNKPVTRILAEEQCANRIAEAFEEEQPVLVHALPAMGKSSGVVKWAAETGNPITVLTARHELYEQYIDWAEREEMDLDRVKRLPSFHNDCPTARDEDNHGSKWRKRVRAEYISGRSGGEIHGRASALFGEQLPCQRYEDCPYEVNRKYDPDDYDLLVGHYTHATTFRPVANRYVVFDEFPEDDFLTEFDSSEVSRAVTGFFQKGTTVLDYESWKDLSEEATKNRQDPNSVFEWLVETEVPIEEAEIVRQFERNLGAEDCAPMLIQTVAISEELDNGWQYIDFGYGRKAVRSPYDETITILLPPFLDHAISVIALDGTPTIEKWRLLLGDNLQYRPVLSEENNRAYLRKGLGLNIIQTTNDVKPYASRKGDKVSLKKDLALIDEISNRESQDLYIISSRKALELYHENGLNELLDCIHDEDGECESTEHFFNLKGSNKFDQTRLGLVVGCPQRSDEIIEKWAALAGRSVKRRKTTDGVPTMGRNLDFGSFGNRLLRGSRENEVLQAIMRFGRRHEDDNKGATVYVHTWAIPKWVEPKRNIASIRTFEGKKGGVKKVINSIREMERWDSREWKTGELHSVIEELFDNPNDRISEQALRGHLNTLEELGYLVSRREKSPGSPKLWRNICLESVGKFGHVHFDSDGSSL